MLFLGHNDKPPYGVNYSENPYAKMRYDSMDIGRWNGVKERFPEVQLAEHLIHSFFLDPIDQKLIDHTLPMGSAQQMVDIIVELRKELEKVAESCQSFWMSPIKRTVSLRLLKLLDELEEMAQS